MKKVVRLTESDLMRIIKRVISEQSETPSMGGKVDQIVKLLQDAIEGLAPDSMEKANNCAKAVYMINDKSTYDLVKKKLNVDYIMGYIGEDLSVNGPIMDKPEPWAKVLRQMGQHLSKFNKVEENQKLVWNRWSFGDKTL